ncbi:MAG: glycoside hydrolase family 5 protein [Bacteroidales bacterium]
MHIRILILVLLLTWWNVESQSRFISRSGIPQEVPSYPGYNTDPAPPDTTGMLHSAMEIAGRIELGWNLGNSLEATGGETSWGNPEVTEALIELVKENGFNAIRVPCAWDLHADQETAEIDPDWLNRVEEVVRYCLDNDLYVLLNIHWDGGWLENHCTPDRQKENNAKQKAYWEQIATHFRDFDDHLLFAGTNEPNVENAEQMEVLDTYLQTFVNAVRSTGGRNAYRVLVIQGPSTDIEKTSKLMKSLPQDPVPDRMMAEIHYYTPWNFAGLTRDESWGKQFYYWGKDYHSATDTERNATWGEEEAVDRLFGMMKEQFVDQGIPVVLGEYAAVRRSRLTGDTLQLHLASRAYYHRYVTHQAKLNGLIPFYWDNGGLRQGSGIFDRKAGEVADLQTLKALMEGAENGNHGENNGGNNE